jgi:D-tyrosyl-tRNA(Tyr) deacylase
MVPGFVPWKAGVVWTNAVRAVVQRVSEASVSVEGKITGQIGAGLCALIGVGQADAEKDARWLSDKIVDLRIFEDESGKMNRSLLESKGALLAISQFTLFGDVRKGGRPGFIDAARPETAQPLYDRFCALVRARGIEVQEGVFRATMQVRLVNEGPVTLLLDSKKMF